MKAPLPPYEQERLRALQDLEVLDSPPEPAFDELARIAAYLCGTPTAVVTLIDRERQWFKAVLGLEVRETHRDLSFCAYTILQADDVLVVTDAVNDARFSDNSLVLGPPFIRFYVGASIRDSHGRPLGALAVIDYRPRTIEADKLEILKCLARQAAAQLELRRRLHADQVGRVATERTLEQSESALRNAQEHAQIGSWEMDPRGKNRWSSEQMYRMIGRDPGLGPPTLEEFLDDVHDDDRERVRREYASLIDRFEPTTIIFSIKAMGGRRRRHFKSVAECVRDREGNPLKFRGTVMDVTDFVEAQERAQEQERRQKTLIENLPGVAYRCSNDEQWTIEYASPMFQSLTGHGVEEALSGRITFARLIHPDDLERIREAVAKSLVQRSRYQLDYRIRRKDGVERWVREYGCGVFKPDDTLDALEGFILDITDARVARVALEQNERRLRALIDSARDAVMQLSPEGQIESLNPAFETITGGRREEWVDRPFLQLVYDEDRQKARQLLERLAVGEKPPVVELRLQAVPERQVQLEFVAAAEMVNGRAVGLVGIGRDVTDRKRLEEQLQQAQRMESIGQLAGGVAHDFNNILAVILMQAALLETTENPSPSMREGLQQIELSAERAAGLTRQLLAFSRRQHMQLVDVDLVQVVADLSKMLRRILGEDVELQTQSFGGRLPLVHADVGMLEQVVMNLVVNARDAMPRGGRLIIATSKEAAKESESAGTSSVKEWVVLTVSDTGVGIAPEIRTRIFEPFFTTKDVGKGTGLGLATVYGIVKQHGGTIEVQSDVGAGATFRVRLPAVDRVEATRVPAVRFELPGGTETLLVVEDEHGVRELVRMVLEQKGYRVLLASTGPAALEVWRQAEGQVDLVVTDLVMPEGMSGLELVGQLHTEAPKLPVIYTSGYSADAVAQGTRLVEGTNFIQKPFGPIKLLKTVRSALDRTHDS